MLERQARRCKISESKYMRRLLNRCVPREARLWTTYGMMNELKVIREDMDVLAQMAAATGLMDANAIDVQLRNLRKTSEKIGMAVAGEYDEDD